MNSSDSPRISEFPKVPKVPSKVHVAKGDVSFDTDLSKLRNNLLDDILAFFLHVSDVSEFGEVGRIKYLNGLEINIRISLSEASRFNDIICFSLVGFPGTGFSPI